MGNTDTAWKDIIQSHFKEFIEFYFSRIAGCVNLRLKPRNLEKELRKFAPQSKSPGRYADLLMEVSSLSNTAVSELIHIEIQGKKDPYIRERLFQYTYRIYDRFRVLPLTLIVCTDDDPSFYPESFEIVTTEKYLRVEFIVAKMLYFEGRTADPDFAGNLFAFVTYIQSAVNTLNRRAGNITERQREEKRYHLKRRLSMDLLLGSSYADEYIRPLLLFLDWILQLPEELEEKLTDDIDNTTGGLIMPYIPSWERIALKKGMKRGLEQGMEEGKIEDKQQILIRLLRKKFSLTEKEETLIEENNNLNELDSAIDAILTAETKEEILSFLKQ